MQFFLLMHALLILLVLITFLITKWYFCPLRIIRGRIVSTEIGPTNIVSTDFVSIDSSIHKSLFLQISCL